MYYRVAIQVNQQPAWQWKSTVLSSLDTLFRFLRLYSALPQDRLRVFSSSREGMDELLAHVNNGAESNSVTAAQFLQERKISIRTMTREASAPGIEANPERVAIAVTTNPSLKETSKVQTSFGEGSMSSLEKQPRRLPAERVYPSWCVIYPPLTAPSDARPAAESSDPAERLQRQVFG